METSERGENGYRAVELVDAESGGSIWNRRRLCERSGQLQAGGQAVRAIMVASLLIIILAGCGGSPPIATPAISSLNTIATPTPTTTLTNVLPMVSGILTIDNEAADSLSCPIPGPAYCHSFSIDIPRAQGWLNATRVKSLAQPYNYFGNGASPGVYAFLIQSSTASPSIRDVTAYLGFGRVSANYAYNNSNQFLQAYHSYGTNFSQVTTTTAGTCQAAWITYDSTDPVHHNAVKVYDMYIWAPAPTAPDAHTDDWLIEMQATPALWPTMFKDVQADVQTVKTAYC